MIAPAEEPTYNLKVVVQETGLKPDTLRVWERRYGLPKPQRTAGGHRLYSARDIATIKWLMDRKNEGMSISRAVALWDSLEAEGHDPLQSDQDLATAQAPSLVAGATVAELRQEWLSACLEFDEQRAEQVLAQAFALYSPETVCIELLQKGVATMGDDWYQGAATVQQEHFASTLAARRLDALIMGTPRPTRPGRALLACPPEENHILGPLFFTYLLRRRGWDGLFLGANVPAERLEATLMAIRPQIVIVAAQQLNTAASLLDLARVLQLQGIPLAYGGLVFNLIPNLRERIPGHFLGEHLSDGVREAERLLSSPAPRGRQIPPPPYGYQEALAHFRKRRSRIESAVWRKAEALGIPHPFLTMANTDLALNIMAALKLGDLTFVGADIEWVRGLIRNRQLPDDQLAAYLVVYRWAVTSQLDEQGQPIVDWLDQVLGTP